jgi:hypothetical protein
MEYQRTARRIRARWRGQPDKIHAALAELNRGDFNVPGAHRIVEGMPVARRTDWSHSAILGHRGPVARDFADLVSSRLIGPLLTYTQRRDLLREAKARGINGFEANLIIAAVLHHHGRLGQVRMPCVEPTRAQLRIPLWLIAAAVELAIVAGAWQMLSINR